MIFETKYDTVPSRDSLITCCYTRQCSFVGSCCSVKLRHNPGFDDIKSALPSFVDDLNALFLLRPRQRNFVPVATKEEFREREMQDLTEEIS